MGGRVMVVDVDVVAVTRGVAGRRWTGKVGGNGREDVVVWGWW